MAVIRPLIFDLTVQKYYIYFIYANFSAIILHFLNILHTFHKKSTLSSALLPLIVRHHLLQVLCILLGYIRRWRVVILNFEQVREHLLRSHAFRVAHRIDSTVHTFGHHLKF